MHTLVKTDHFLPKEDGDDQEDSSMDSSALTSIIDNVEMFLSDPPSKQQMFNYFAETNYFASISTVPNSVKVRKLISHSISSYKTQRLISRVGISTPKHWPYRSYDRCTA